MNLEIDRYTKLLMSRFKKIELAREVALLNLSIKIAKDIHPILDTFEKLQKNKAGSKTGSKAGNKK